MGHRTDQHLEHTEHTQHHAQDPFDRKIAMSMAVLAAVLAGVTMLSHRGHTETLRLATEATQFHTQESDAWNYYQAKNVIGFDYDGQLKLLPLIPTSEDTAKARKEAEVLFKDVLDKYRGPLGPDKKKRQKDKGQLAELKAKAEKLQAQGKEATTKSHHVHGAVDWIDGGHLALDLSLVLCTVALLTRQRSFWYTGLLVGLIGASVAGVGVYQWVFTEPGAHAHH
jgi:hypothetical protein